MSETLMKREVSRAFPVKSLLMLPVLQRVLKGVAYVLTHHKPAATEAWLTCDVASFTLSSFIFYVHVGGVIPQ